MKDTELPQSASRILNYSIATGLGLVAVDPLLAARFSFDPVGGLPITVDTNNIIGNEVAIDLDGDMVDDFNIYYSTSYGGGFAITTINRADGINNPRVQTDFLQSFGNSIYNNPQRHDTTEFIHVDDNSTLDPSFVEYSSTFKPMFLDNDGQTPPADRPFTLFRDNPGHIGLSLGRPVGQTTAFAGMLEISVNTDGTVLTIHSGAYRDDNDDLQILPDEVFEDGFESVSVRNGLDALAFGDSD